VREKLKAWITTLGGQQKGINLHPSIDGNEAITCNDAECCKLFQSTAKSMLEGRDGTGMNPEMGTWTKI